MRKQLQTAILCILISTALYGCFKDTDSVKNPPLTSDNPELITTVLFTFNDITDTSTVLEFYYKDLDGIGGKAPIIDTILLKDSTIYTASLELLNESDDSNTNITEEILQEAQEHIICYTPKTDNIIITRLDTDGEYELGLETEWVTNQTGTNKVNILLKHQHGDKDGSCSPGETDLEVDFVTRVE